MKRIIIPILVCTFLLGSCGVLCPCTKTKGTTMIDCLPTPGNYLSTSSPSIQIGTITNSDRSAEVLDSSLENYKFEVELRCWPSNTKHIWITRYHDFSFLYPSGKVIVMASFYGQLEKRDDTWILNCYLYPKWKPAGGSDQWSSSVPKELYDSLKQFLEEFKRYYLSKYNQ